MTTVLYVYGTGERTDGFAFAVGEMRDGGPANGALALFQNADDAHRFVNATQAETGCTVITLPSAETETPASDDQRCADCLSLPHEDCGECDCWCEIGPTS